MEAGKWGVGIPQFYVHRHESNRIIPPKASTVNDGHSFYLRTDVESEELAGKLFAFQYKVMYGRGATAESNAVQDQGPTSPDKPKETPTTDDNEEKKIVETTTSLPDCSSS